MPFTPPLTTEVALLPDGRIRTVCEVVWTGTRMPNPDRVVVPAGAVSDLGTVPRLARAVLPHDGPASRAFLVHDELCEARKRWWRELAAWRVHAAERSAIGLRPNRPAPVAPPFDPVDADAVMRVVLAELGTGVVRWVYWVGVRWAALWSPYRREGWWRPGPLAALLVLTVPAVLLVLPAMVGSGVSRIFLTLVELLAWPWERVARRRRDAATRRVLSAASQGGVGWELVPGSPGPGSCRGRADVVCAGDAGHAGDCVPVRFRRAGGGAL